MENFYSLLVLFSCSGAESSSVLQAICIANLFSSAAVYLKAETISCVACLQVIFFAEMSLSYAQSCFYFLSLIEFGRITFRIINTYIFVFADNS